jgi:hypothetical protein
MCFSITLMNIVNRRPSGKSGRKGKYLDSLSPYACKLSLRLRMSHFAIAATHELGRRDAPIDVKWGWFRVFGACRSSICLGRGSVLDI